MIEAVPFEQGDVRWVFPEIGDEAPIRQILARICGKIEKLASSFGVRAGDTGSGLEYVKTSGFPLAGIFGRVDVSDVSFRADLYFERHSALERRWGPPWVVSVSIEVQDSDGQESTLVAIEEKSTVVQIELTGVKVFENYVDWLITRASERSLGYWRIQADKISETP